MTLNPQNPRPENNQNNTVPSPIVTPGQNQTLDSKILYGWMIPVMVLMVVGATIYLSVLDRKIEYVYSLASACFGYYFGFISPRPAKPAEMQPQLMSGVNELTK